MGLNVNILIDFLLLLILFLIDILNMSFFTSNLNKYNTPRTSINASLKHNGLQVFNCLIRINNANDLNRLILIIVYQLLVYIFPYALSIKQFFI